LHYYDHHVSSILQSESERTTESTGNHFNIKKGDRGVVVKGCGGPPLLLSRRRVPQSLEPPVSRKFLPLVQCAKVFSLLAAYDMGAAPHHLQKIYNAEAAGQRPRVLEERHKTIVITKNNWVQYFGDQRYRRHCPEYCHVS
jgi:hypothetical protein